MPTERLVLYASLYLIGFGLIHSIGATDTVKNLARRAFGRGFALYRFVYNLIQFVVLGGYVYLFRPYDQVLYELGMPWFALAVAVKLLCVALIVWCLFVAFDGLEFLGLRQISALWTERAPDTDMPLKTNGPFAWCRHPVYLGTIVYFFASPHMTVLLFVFAVFTLVYALFGSIPEEHRMRRHFGEAYAEYQKRTKRIIPFVI